MFADRYPGVHVVCPAGAQKRVAEVVPSVVPFDRVRDDVVEIQTLDGTKQREGAMIVRAGNVTSLVLNDAVFNMPHLSGFTGFVLRRVTGSTGGPRVSRIMKWFVIADAAAFRAHLERLADLPNLAHVVVSHHEVIHDDPAGTLRRVASAL